MVGVTSKIFQAQTIKISGSVIEASNIGGLANGLSTPAAQPTGLTTQLPDGGKANVCVCFNALPIFLKYNIFFTNYFIVNG